MFAVFVGSIAPAGHAACCSAATGELVSERAGVLNMSVEGMMLTAAFGGAIGAWATGSPMLGLADRRPRGAAGGAAAGVAEHHAARQPDRHRHRHQHPGAGRAPRWPTARSSAPRSRAAIPGLGEVDAAAAGRHPGVRRRRCSEQVWLLYAGAGADRAGGLVLRYTAHRAGHACRRRRAASGRQVRPFGDARALWRGAVHRL